MNYHPSVHAAALGGPSIVFSCKRFRDTPRHSTNEAGATNCYIQKTEEKHADRHENIDAMKASDGVRCAGTRSSVGRRVRSVTKLRLEWYGGGVLIAAAALKTPTRNGDNAQGINLTFCVGSSLEIPVGAPRLVCV